MDGIRIAFPLVLEHRLEDADIAAAILRAAHSNSDPA